MTYAQRYEIMTAAQARRAGAIQARVRNGATTPRNRAFRLALGMGEINLWGRPVNRRCCPDCVVCIAAGRVA